MSRDMLFLSHANPEDNIFTRWLALQLAKDGYGVWCDLTKLLGGEHFWKDAEEAIRTRTIKFIYVLSRVSNEKDGPRSELQIAANVARKNKSLHDFIIPLHIDDLPHTEINVQLTSLHAVPFEASWARGYAQLVELLEREQVPKKTNFNPAAVSLWWRSQFNAERGLKPEPDIYLSNLLQINSTPDVLWLHTLARSTPGPVEPELRLAHAGFMDGIDLVTFATAEDTRPALGTSVSVVKSDAFPVKDILLGKCSLDSKKVRYFIARLLNGCWERWISAQAFGIYALSNRATCYFFRKGNQPNVDIRFTNPQGKHTYRSVVGYATQPDGTRRYWHFGVQARPVFAPLLGYLISSHVIFTADGATPWASPQKMHGARRRQCKNWFNAEWRDRLLATLHWLSQGSSTLHIPAGGSAGIDVSTTPQHFVSDLSYADPPTRQERVLLAESDDVQVVPSEEVGTEDEEDEDDAYEEDDLGENIEEDKA